MELLLIISIAFFIALLFSLLGLGGGIIYTPLFILLGLHPLTAIPMALFLNSITTSSASVTYLKQRMVDVGISSSIIPPSILGTLAGMYLAHRVDADVIVLLLSIALIFVSIRMLFFNNIGTSTGMSEKKKRVIGGASGFFIGVIASLVGIGGGSFTVPLLLVLGFETKNAVATSSFIVTFVSFSGFLWYLALGQQQVIINILLYAGVAAFIGAQAGSRLIFNRTSSRVIGRLFALVLLLVVGKLLYGL